MLNVGNSVEKMKYSTTTNHMSHFSRGSFIPHKHLCRLELMPNKKLIFVSTQAGCEYKAGLSERHTEEVHSLLQEQRSVQSNISFFTGNSTITFEAKGC